jgi:hypothetical protein
LAHNLIVVAGIATALGLGVGVGVGLGVGVGVGVGVGLGVGEGLGVGDGLGPESHNTISTSFPGFCWHQGFACEPDITCRLAVAPMAFLTPKAISNIPVAAAAQLSHGFFFLLGVMIVLPFL